MYGNLTKLELLELEMQKLNDKRIKMCQDGMSQKAVDKKLFPEFSRIEKEIGIEQGTRTFKETFN